MFIIGNGSSQTYLNWFEPRVTEYLPEPMIVSISVWYCRLLMLFWALWLAFALHRWLKAGWKSFTHGGIWKQKPVVVVENATLVPEMPDDAGDHRSRGRISKRLKTFQKAFKRTLLRSPQRYHIVFVVTNACRWHQWNSENLLAIRIYSC